MSVIKDLKNKIKELNEKITEIQSQCNHPVSARKIEHKGSTGGYDLDHYWEDHTCTLCEKFWTENDRYER